jgi:membrane protease subunit (stomatin/prohibitin family)
MYLARGIEKWGSANLSINIRAAWHGARIILRQVSPESIDIFDFILEFHWSCSGNWDVLVAQHFITQEDCDAFLDYAATFLSNIGNYYVRCALFWQCHV